MEKPQEAGARADQQRPSFADVEKENAAVLHGEIVNSSGHPDQLKRQYGLFAICGMALTIDNAWVVLGTSLSISIANGGAPGVLYELLVACFYYGFIAASLAELASSIPTAGGVYHFATITPGPEWGRVIGFFTGSINFFGWIFNLSSICYIMAQVLVSLYYVYHQDVERQPWNIYVAFVLIIIVITAFNIFCNSLIPYLQNFGLFMIVVGGLVTIIVVAAMPTQHASNSFVWTEFTENNVTGWQDGVAFLIGVLNGSFTIGTPEASTHLAEDLPNPRRDVPRSIAAQMILGTLTSFFFAIAVLYGISDIDGIVKGGFPLEALYLQATGSPGAAFGLLFIVFLALIPCLCGSILTVSRIWWALARDNVTPFSAMFARVNERLSCPVEATVLTAVLAAGLGAIPLGSKTAFTNLTGSFIILSTTSYALAIGGNMATGRRNVPRADFYMPGAFGWAINGITILLIVFFDIMFMFPPLYPTDVALMNYNCVILVGVVVLTGIWWAIHGQRKYKTPKITELYTSTHSDVAVSKI